MNIQTSPPLFDDPPDAPSGSDERDAPAEPDEPTRRGLRRPLDLVQLAFYAIPLVILLPAAWVHRYMFDDGYIYLRVVQEIVAGNGPVFNPGERIEAYTSPLWVALVSAEAAIFGRWVELGWLAVFTGLVLTTIAIVFGLMGSSKLLRFVRRGEVGRAFPIGAIALVCLPPMWFYTTSGLETSMSFAWLAVCFYGLIPDPVPAGSPFERHAPRAWVAVFIGLGFLVRPEFALYTIGFWVVLWVVRLGTWRQRLISLAWMFAIPLAYQLFRMGYFATLLPNTAIAKGASDSDWSRGMTYLRAFTDAYWIIIPVAALVALLAFIGIRLWRVGPITATLVLAPLAAALVNAVYVIKVGGDYLHARFWLPPLFVMILPVFCWDFRIPKLSRAESTEGESAEPALSVSTIVPLAGAAVLLLWSVWCMASFSPYRGNFDDDFKLYGLVGAAAPGAVSLDDYNLLTSVGRRLAAHQAAGDDILVDVTRPLDAQLFLEESPFDAAKAYPLKNGQGVVGYFAGVGVGSVAAGPDVWVVDRHGLADVLVARLAEKNGTRDPQGRLVPGHEKEIPFAYAQARFTHSTMGEPANVAFYRSAMSCGQLADLFRATNEPLGVGRFVENVIKSPSFTMMTVPSDPKRMYEEFCQQ